MTLEEKIPEKITGFAGGVVGSFAGYAAVDVLGGVLGGVAGYCFMYAVAERFRYITQYSKVGEYIIKRIK